MNPPDLSRFRSLPDLVNRLTRPFPLLPLEILFNLSMKNIVRRNPELFLRLGEHAGKTYVIEMTDLPFCVLLETNPDRPCVLVRRSLPQDRSRVAATISGSILAHLRMITGREDADALFFSREIVINGDIGAALALRNAIDDMDIGTTSLLRGALPL